MAQTLAVRCRSFLTSTRNLKTAWMITAGIVAFYVGTIRPHEMTTGINNSKATGLAAFVDQAEVLAPHSGPMLQKGVIGGVPGGFARHARIVRTALIAQPADADKAGSDRKMVRTTTLDMIVQNPSESAEKIRVIAEQSGGFLISSEVRGDQAATAANLSIRVPVERNEEVRAEIRKLGIRVETEKVDAEDVTRQYTDQDANLRNLKAEEQQYLSILKQARTVKDTLDVSEKLSDVRGQIEQQQAEFNALSKQIETVAINLSLRTEAEARVMGLNWRPLYQVKMALRDGLDGVATYLATMTALVFFLPTVILWMATIVLAGWVAWRTSRWVARYWFGLKPAQPVEAK